MRDFDLEEVVASLDFRESLRYKFRRDQHINVLEGHAWKSMIKLLCSQSDSLGHTRVMCGIDSQVLCCAIQRGRSGSTRLNEMLRSALPYQLLCRVRCVPLCLSTSANPADDPTRGAPLRKSSQLSASLVDEVSRIREKEPVVWHSTRAGWVHMKYDQTLGYPGEGPEDEEDDDDDDEDLWGGLRHEGAKEPPVPPLRRNRVAAGPPVNLKDSVLPLTATRYRVRVEHFSQWLLKHHGVQLSALIPFAERLVELLQVYLQWMYEQHMPVSHGSWCLAGL
eukprot:4753747-Amphidinium_carterae.1